MVQKLFTLTAIFILSFTTLSAQSGAGSEEESVWWGYYSKGMSVNAIGTGWSVTYDVASYFPGDTYFAKGAVMNGLRLSLPNTSNVKNVKVWVSKTLPASGAQADVFVQNVSLTGRTLGSFTDVTFKTPYTVTDEGVYVGYSLTISTISNDYDLRPIAYTGDVHTTGSLFLRTSEGYYTQWDDYSTDFGALAIQVLFSGNLQHHAVGVKSAEEVSSTLAGTAVVPVTFENFGVDGVQDFDYTITSDGKTGEEQHFSMKSAFSAQGTFVAKIPVAVGNKIGDVEKTLTVTRVNGEENAVSTKDASTTLKISVLGETLPKKVLVEEFSGTWCMWCPLGTRGIELSEEKFGDKLIAVEVHDNDVMWNPDNGYDPLIQTLIGLPACFINRGPDTDPYYGSAGGDYYGLDADIEQELSYTSEATLEAEAAWNAALTAIDAKARVKFQISASKSEYALGYIVTAGTLTGTDENWVQSNALSGDNSFAYDENLIDLVNSPKYLTNHVYHNVVVAATGVEKGVAGSLSGAIVSGKVKEHSQTIDMGEMKLVQDKDDLSLVVFLINTTTGRIVNAEKVKVTGAPSGLRDVSNSSGVSCVYNLQGQRLRGLQHGVNILRHADGRFEKVFVK